MSVKPLHDRVLVKRMEEEETVVGGIVIPDTAREKSQKGEVIAVGDGRELENGTVVPLAVHVGDRILFGKFGGTDVLLDGQEFLILRESEILAVLNSASEAQKGA